MDFNDDEGMRELQDFFLDEAKELLGKVEHLSLQIEKNPHDEDTYQELARLTHNLKGPGKAVGFDDISHFAHLLEDFILGLKKGKIESSRNNLDFLFSCLDLLRSDAEKISLDKNFKLNYDVIAVQVMIS